MKLDAKIPHGPLEQKWDIYTSEMKLISPTGKKKLSIIVVGSGLAGASASASLGELGYTVHTFTLHDSPRRAHSIAAQGGINAAKNYRNDGDSTKRLFYDTLKGGDFRSREANVFRLAQISSAIIDHCVALGVPFAREYGGLLDTRSFGGAQVSRTFYARGQTGQQLLLAAYSALMRQVAAGTVFLHTRHDMLDLVVNNSQAIGIITRNLISGVIEYHAADAVVLATGGYSRVFFLSTNAATCNVSPLWTAYKKGAAFANPCFTQIHPTCIPVAGDHQNKLTLMSESLRNDGRVWVPCIKKDPRDASQIPEQERNYYLEKKYPSFGNLVPRDVASRNAKQQADEGFGVGDSGYAVYLDFKDALSSQGKTGISEKYGNLFDMYKKITTEDPYQVPMRIYPAPHYTMGGLWVDYNLMSTIDGLFVLGEANFSDHGANRLGASALMQGLADGFFILPQTIGAYFAGKKHTPAKRSLDCFEAAVQDVQKKITRLLTVKGTKPATFFHRTLGRIMWNNAGMSRSSQGLTDALSQVTTLSTEFWNDLRITGSDSTVNQQLEEAARIADYLEFSSLMIRDALERNESCGGHFRVEYQTNDGEALRNDSDFSCVHAWTHIPQSTTPELNREPLTFESIALSQRSYV